MTKQTPHMKPRTHKERTATEETAFERSVGKLIGGRGGGGGAWCEAVKLVLLVQNLTLKSYIAPNYISIIYKTSQ